MPKITLKPKSPEFADDTNSKLHKARHCDMPGCRATGDCKAPKDRSLKDHYWFCTDHVTEYNKAWDFFSGMSQQDIEEQIVRSALWDRPTRRFDPHAREAATENLHRKSWQTYHFSDDEPKKEKSRTAGIDRNTPEFEAMAIMGLEPPLSLKVIKARYKELVKIHHPDINGGDKKSEEMLKSVNMAYTILKLACEKYEKLST
jgi:hypothetical protein